MQHKTPNQYSSAYDEGLILQVSTTEVGVPLSVYLSIGGQVPRAVALSADVAAAVAKDILDRVAQIREWESWTEYNTGAFPDVSPDAHIEVEYASGKRSKGRAACFFWGMGASGSGPITRWRLVRG